MEESTNIYPIATTPDKPIYAYITNLGKYNEYELVGKWHGFPTTKRQIQQTLKEIGVDGVRYEEFFITDYDCSISGIYRGLPEYASINELNYLASKLMELPDWDIEKYEAIAESGDYVGSVQDMINLTDNLDSFDFMPGVRTDEDLGYYWIDESGCYDLDSMGNLANYIDYERFGRDVRLEEGGVFTDRGYVYNNSGSFDRSYDGIHVPDEYRVFAFPPKAKSEPELER